MNHPTAAQLSQDSSQHLSGAKVGGTPHFNQAAAYTGDMLVTITTECVIVQELDDIVLDMSEGIGGV